MKQIPHLPARLDSARGAMAALCSGYFALLIGLLSRRAFWLDEVIQLIGTRDQSIRGMVRYIAINAGATPLGYFVQHAFLVTLGYSRFSARIPSLICSTIACASVWAIGKKLQKPAPVLAMCIFMLLPLQFRYAIEARPYSLALAIATLSTLLFLSLLDRVTIPKAIGYSGIAVLGVYTQPFSIFIPLSHALWSTYYARHNKELDRVRNATAISSIVAGMLFMPWLLYAKAGWTVAVAAIAAGNPGSHFNLDLRTPLMIFREISGAGYAGGVLLAAGVIIGLASSKSTDGTKNALLCLTVVVPIAGAILADAVFGYFIAIRQMIYVLPSLTILAAEGFHQIFRYKQIAGLALVTSFLAIAIWYDYRWSYRSKEDWEAATRMLAVESEAGCIIPVPAHSVPVNTIDLYDFFESEIPNRICRSDISQSSVVILALSPYRSIRDEKSAIARLASLGFEPIMDRTAGGTKIVRFEEAPASNLPPLPCGRGSVNKAPGASTATYRAATARERCGAKQQPFHSRFTGPQGPASPRN